MADRKKSIPVTFNTRQRKIPATRPRSANSNQIRRRLTSIEAQVTGIHEQVKRIMGMDVGIRLITNTQIRIREELQILWKKFNVVRRMAVTLNLMKDHVLEDASSYETGDSAEDIDMADED